MSTDESIKATGGLKVWLIIMMVFGVISILSDIRLASTNGVKAILLILINLVSVFGVFQLLKGLRLGFYLICACTIFVTLIYLFSGSIAAAILVWITPLIVWLLAKKQWEIFQ